MEYKNKYFKYKNKYLNDKLGGYKSPAIISPQVSETEHYQTKFVKGHGGIIGGQTFELPKGCNVITLTDVDVNVSALEIYDAIIKFFLSKNIDLFENNNSTYIKTFDCDKMEKLLNIVGTSCNFETPTVFNIRNHVGPVVMNEMLFNFSDPPCDIEKCSIDLYNPSFSPYVPIKENLRLEWELRNRTRRVVLNSYYLSDLIEREGKGTYIIRSCRKINARTETQIELVRQVSNETPPSELKNSTIND